jgi:hypothetical protein
VVISLTPLLFNVFALVLRNGSWTRVRLEAFIMSGELIRHGELLLIIAAICAAAVGELLGSGSRNRNAKIVVGGASILILIVASYCFANISAAHLYEGHISLARVRDVSGALYLSGLVTSGCCVILR